MTRAMDQLVLTRAVYRRRYGTDMPEASVPSRFLAEIPTELIEEMGTTRGRSANRWHSPTSPKTGEQWGTPVSGSTGKARTGVSEPQHYAYEDEDQSAVWKQAPSKRPAAPKYNSIDNIAEFFASRGKKFNMPKISVEEPKG